VNIDDLRRILLEAGNELAKARAALIPRTVNPNMGICRQLAGKSCIFTP